MIVLPIQGATYDSKEHNGPWCIDHMSQYCTHAQEYIGARRDTPDIQNAIQDEKNSNVIYITVPIFPMYSVWEHLYYEVTTIDVLGTIGLMGGGASSNRRKDVDCIRRLMPGESARDLGMTLRQQFEDELDEWIDKLTEVRGGPPPWIRCKSAGHGFKYQQVASKIVTPANIKTAIDGGGDTEMVYGMLYCYMRHGRCLFCYVNEYNRDAVRVNPALSGFFRNVSTESNFDDLVPN